MKPVCHQTYQRFTTVEQHRATTIMTHHLGLPSILDRPQPQLSQHRSGGAEFQHHVDQEAKLLTIPLLKR